MASIANLPGTGRRGRPASARPVLDARVGCGTAYYACLVGKRYIEQLARIPADADLAS